MKQLLTVGGYMVLGVAVVIGAVMTYPDQGKIQIITPDKDVDASVAALSGSWQANSDGLISRVVVERVRPTWASVLIVWSDRVTANPKANWQRVKARVLPNAELQWGYPVKYTLAVKDGAATLHLHREVVLGEHRYSTFAIIPLQRMQLLAENPS